MFRLIRVCRLGCIVLIPLLMTACGEAPVDKKETPEEGEQVEVRPVNQRRVVTEQPFPGTVVPLRRSVVGSAVDGRVINFPINEGDYVEKDATLAQLRTGTLKIELASAKAELELRQQELMELENGSRAEEIEQARAAMEGAEALKKYSATKFKRYQLLLEQESAVTVEEMEEVNSSSVQAEQSFVAARAAFDLAEQGPRAERIDQAKANRLAQEEKVKQIEDRIARHTIKAPFSGFVVAEHTEVGEWLSEGNPVAEIIQLDFVEVEVFVLENYISHLKVGMPVPVTLDAVPGRGFSGEVSLIVPQADLLSRSFPVKIRVENPRHGESHPLKAGMLAIVSLEIGRRDRVLLVHKDALVLGGVTPEVFAFHQASPPDLDHPDLGEVHKVSVKLGVEHEHWIQVEGNLEQGDEVVVQGNERLRDRQRVMRSRSEPPPTPVAARPITQQ